MFYFKLQKFPISAGIVYPGNIIKDVRSKLKKVCNKESAWFLVCIRLDLLCGESPESRYNKEC